MHTASHTFILHTTKMLTQTNAVLALGLKAIYEYSFRRHIIIHTPNLQHIRPTSWVYAAAHLFEPLKFVDLMAFNTLCYITLPPNI